MSDGGDDAGPIREPGDYVTRAGSRATVDTVNGGGTFSVKGSVWRMFRGKPRRRGHDIWRSDGRYMAIGEHQRDIVGPWPEESDEPGMSPG
ncbi:MAG: hypothetical protein KJS79_03425 [Rhodospirillales bacterium]|uniref:hypothetical protein n=1 Tax=Acidiphilium multivorum TaxID=62140 RepID=UPI001F4C0E0B|nr:hypothetical protein [Acidiphilium multivorum]MBU6355770.1 hypothetical protein [Rhodospirillales bacterium]UNC16282.1 hypothetical protein FE249_18895 [Acidiphilium multivorum]